MQTSLTHFHALIKLFRSLYHLRVLSKRKHERLPLKLHLNYRQRKLTQQAKRDWCGGYILTEGGDYVYVPQELDLSAIRWLVQGPANEPIIAKVCPPGGTVIDVGANLGDWSLPMAKAVGAKGLMYAFEPVPFLSDALTKTFQINGLKNSFVSNMALSDSIGEAAFAIYDNVEQSKLTADVGKGVQTKVSTTTLDAFCVNEDLDRLDFIKIDVETHEAAMIRGGAGAIGRFQPAIVLEAGQREEKREHRQSIRDTLEPLEYRIAGILLEHGIIETDWDAYVAFDTPFMKQHYCNILCLPSQKERR